MTAQRYRTLLKKAIFKFEDVTPRNIRNDIFHHLMIRGLIEYF